MSSQLKPPEHYGREAHQHLQAMHEAILGSDDVPDWFAEDIETTMDRLRFEYEILEGGELPDA